nr:putative GPI-anchored protein pfl2 [Zootoca vivipara]
MKLFILYVFATMIASAKSLSCECTNCTSGTTCTADKEGACIAVTGNIKTAEGSNATPGIFSGCWSRQTPLACEEEEILVTAGKQFSWNTKTICCRKDNCNAVNPEALKEDTTPSELMCPTCFALGSESCSATNMKCAKSQNHCLTITGTITTGTTTELFFGEGCATPTASNLASGTKLTFGEVTYMITSSHIEKAKDGPSQDIPTSSSNPSTTLSSSNSSTTPTPSKTPTTLSSSNSSTTSSSSKTPTTLSSFNSSTIPTSSKTPTTLSSSNSSTTPTSSKTPTTLFSSNFSTTPTSTKTSTIPNKSAKPATTYTSASSVFTILLPSLLGLLLDKFLY